MIKHYLMEFFNWWYTIIIIAVIIVSSVFFLHALQLNSFNQQAIQVIQRSGGVTADAKGTLNNISKKNYLNMFYVDGNNEEVGIGDTVKYQIISKVPFTQGKVLNSSSSYSTVSQVRKGSHTYSDN